MANRTPGRRPAPDGSKVRQHESAIREMVERRESLQEELSELNIELADQIEAARADSISTNDIAVWMKVSGQMVSKHVRRYIDGKVYKSNNRTAGSPKRAVPPRSVVVPPRPPARRKRPGG